MARLRDKLGRFCRKPSPAAIDPALMEAAKKAAEGRKAIRLFDVGDYRLEIESEPRPPAHWKVVRQGEVIEE